ncbi:phage tail protein [Yersinia enterocolitica subsp. palearctica]|nr:phage tail protein [Yersinia enterocolitica subsp. palearctica]
MLKPKLLRQALTDSLQLFQTNPERLKMFVDGGRIVSTLAPSLSFENQYTLTLFIEDFPSDVDYLFVPIWHGCGSINLTSWRQKKSAALALFIRLM